MKLTVQCVRGQGARLCSLKEVGCHGNKTLETPMCMLYTKGGSVPNLSCDILKNVSSVPAMAHMPVNVLAHFEESITGYKKGMATFTGLGDKLVYTSLHDPAIEVRSGLSEKGTVGVWGKGGRIKLDCESFVKLQEAILPDWYQAMCDGDTDRTSTRKRACKSVDRTLIFLDDILDRHRKSERLKDSSIFGCIVGGFDKRERERCTKETVARNCDGYTIEGFHHYGPDTQNFNIQEAKDVIETVVKHLPEDRVRLMHGVWRPDTVLDAIQLGIDVFDASYPHVMSENGEALVFNYQYRSSNDNTHSDGTKTDDAHMDDGLKSGKLSDNCSSGDGFTINLNDKCYVGEFTPLLEGCTCYTCQNFTRAYVNHLLVTKELLARILLTIHNFQWYFGYFVTIREALAEDRFDDLKQCIVKQAALSRPTDKLSGNQLAEKISRSSSNEPRINKKRTDLSLWE